MAKTALTIYLDYKKTMAKAEELESVAKNMKSLADSEFESSLSRLKSNWTGEAANAYIQKANVVKAEILSSANSIQKTASTLRLIAKTTYEAEMAAIAVMSV